MLSSLRRRVISLPWKSYFRRASIDLKPCSCMLITDIRAQQKRARIILIGLGGSYNVLIWKETMVTPESERLFLKIGPDFNERMVAITNRMRDNFLQKRFGEKPKNIRDFSFLFSIKPTYISPTIAKYTLAEGQGQLMSELQENAFKAYYSYTVYDYNGRVIEKNPVGKIVSSKIQDPVTQAVLSMRMHEKAWFNFCLQPIPSSLTKDRFAIQQDSNPEVAGTGGRDGQHYQIELEMIQYQNCEKMQIKRHICLQNREKGYRLIREKKYYQAAIAFRSIAGMSELFSNRLYSQQQQDQIRDMNKHAKLNFLQCFFSIDNPNHFHSFQKIAGRYVDCLLKSNNKGALTHYYHAKWLIMHQQYSQALSSARLALSLKKSPAVLSLIDSLTCRLHSLPLRKRV